MAAFNFPDPTVQQTVTNPITGSTYQWKEPPGKWVVTTKVRAVTDIIYEGDRPPAPRGDYKLWYSTDTLELYFWYEDVNGVGAWVPTSAPITMLEDLDEGLFEVRQLLNQVNAAAITNENEIILIRESLGKVHLQEVLDNGNIANKSIVLTNATDDALLLSPEESRIMVGGVGQDVVPKIELRHSQGVMETSIVKLELDDGGKRFDVECDEKVDNIHFRFEDDDKFIINRKGDAVFTGKVKVAAAVQSDEVPTLGQVTAATDLLQLEIDQITEVFERGAWNHDDGDGITDGTEYVLTGIQTQESFDKTKELLEETYSQCIADANNDTALISVCNRDYTEALAEIPEVGATFNTNDWKIVNKVRFSPYDLDNNTHSFKDVKAGQTLDMYCDDGSGYMVARINKVTTGFWYEEKTLEITPIKTKGIAKGKTRVKIFTLDDTIDTDALDAYVKKAGDEMTGGLSIKPTAASTNLYLKGSENNADGKNIIDVYSNTGREIFWVDSTHVGVNNSAKTPTNSSHLTSKQYVDARRGYGVPYKYRLSDQKAENLAPGEFFIANNNSIYCARYNAESKDMSISSEYITDQNRYGLLKIYAANGNLLHMIEYKELRIGQGANNYIRWLYAEKLKSYSSWMGSETYYLADGLLLPY